MLGEETPILVVSLRMGKARVMGLAFRERHEHNIEAEAG